METKKIPGFYELSFEDQSALLRKLFDKLSPEAQEAFQNRVLDRFDEARESVRNEPIPAALINTPRVNTGDIIAGLKAVDSFVPFGGNRQLTGPIGDRFDQARLQVGIADEAQRQINPKATTAGELAGDVATIATLRAPFVRAKAPALRAERRVVTTRTEKVLPGATGAEIKAVVREKLDDTASKIFTRIFKGRAKNVVTLTPPITKKIGKGLGKAGGVGLEAATFALLTEGDPIKMFGYAAGAQSLGSLGLFFIENPKTGIVTFGSIWLAHQLLKGVGPGDLNVFDSSDDAIHTMIGAYGLGLMGGVMGSGRFRSAAQEKLPIFFDTITQSFRTGGRAFFTDMADSKISNGIEWKVLEKMATQPNFFNPDQVNSLSRAMTSGKEGAFAKEVERLMKDSPSFRKKMNEL